MIYCRQCGKETNNKKFCSRTCSTSYNNSLSPRKIITKYKCKNCGDIYTGNAKNYCSRKCFLEDHNPIFHSRKPIQRVCIACKKEFLSKSRKKVVKFCSATCKAEFLGRDLVKDWLEGKNNGCNKGKYDDDLRKPIRKYILKQANHTCQVCKNDMWNNKPIPLQIHHKDGNAHNNRPKNLLVVCWNCHAQTDTFGSKNRNSTRVSRYK
jgi:endogenous inhibitor of DNA gyrase (YacG/DUF329 family)